MMSLLSGAALQARERQASLAGSLMSLKQRTASYSSNTASSIAELEKQFPGLVTPPEVAESDDADVFTAWANVVFAWKAWFMDERSRILKIASLTQGTHPVSASQFTNHAASSPGYVLFA
jgi:hypothetical protein